MSFATNLGTRVKVSFSGSKGVSLCKQQFAADADINVLMNRYKRPEVLAAAMSAIGSPRVPRFGDFSSLPDYPTICQSMRMADAAFAALPSSVRDKFDNSVEACLEFLSNSGNLEEAVKLGLLDKSVLPVVQKPVVSPVTPVDDKSNDVKGAAPDKVTPTPPKAES